MVARTLGVGEVVGSIPTAPKFFLLKQFLLPTVALFTFMVTAEAKIVRYDLTITQERFNVSGNKEVDFALLVNKNIPAPVLEFTEGDEAEIVVTNGLTNDEVSIHWHGILLPNEMDGVPYVTTPPIFPGKSFTFRFKIRQSGTYWYHSHTNVQEQKGVYGAFIIHPKKKTIVADKDIVVVLSDWSDEDATKILKNLRKDGDYYQFKKKSIRSWGGAIRAGGFGEMIKNEFSRMGGMDLSDVGYDAFLINGKRDTQLLTAHPGEKIRVRIINAAASTYFYVALGDVPMKVISADGVDIEPTMAKEFLMGMAETYDILFEVPEHKNYELKATAQDGTGSASGWIGMGENVPAPVRPAPDLYAPMNHGGHGNHARHASHNPAPNTPDNAENSHHMHHPASHASHESSPAPESTVDTLTVDNLRSESVTAFSPNARVTDVRLVLDGDMSRYVWHINGKAIHQERNITIEEGDVVRFTLDNKTMMHHPMHLHGHFFRVLTDAGERSPLKHTVDVSPHSSRTIEFLANEPGEWMLHCHNLYHLKTGMARVVRYSTFVPRKEITEHQKHDPHEHDHIYTRGRIDAATNVIEGRFSLLKTWSQWDARVESRKHGDEWEEEGDLFRRQWFGKNLNLFFGGTWFDEKGAGAVGVAYLLPMLIQADAVVDHRGDTRLDLGKEFQWTKYVMSEAELRFREGEKTEWKATLMYAPTWSTALGLVFTEDGPGAGFRYQF